MKKVFLSFFAIFFTLSLSSTFALEVESAPTLTSSTETSLSIDWDDVSGALGYYIYYSKTSGTQDGYDFEGVDLIEVSDTVLENLSKDTDYYVAVTVVDDNGNESQYSPEAFFTTSTQGNNASSNSFALEEVVVISANEIELTFNASLDASEDAVREIKLTEKDGGSEIFVSDTSLDDSDPMKLIAVTATELVEEAEYDLTILSMQDTDGNNIESGIDGLTTFTVPRGSTTSYEETEDIPVETVDLGEEDSELNSAGAEQDTGKAGQALSADEITTTAEMAAKDTEALPQTGPETILLLLLAIMLGGGLFFLHTKKA